MGALCHVLEASGLATVGLFPTADIPERMRPPRALVARFPLGRPDDQAFQTAMLLAAFDLLRARSGPVMATFPDVIADKADTSVSCPVPPRHDPSLPPAVDEAVALRPAVARASGRGIVVADPHSVADVLAGFDRVSNGVPWKEAGLPRDILGAARAVLGYYQQAAQGLSDHVPGARQAETWYVQHTAAGATMRSARDQLRQQGAPRPLWYYLLLATQS